MNYELAKQLKDAGFPFKVGTYEYRHCEGHLDSKEEWNDYMDKCSGQGGEGQCSCICHSIPTLSELIEACGEGFNTLTRYGKSVTSGYRAWGWNGDDDCDGSTPEEAVARLWLELNKKQTIMNIIPIHYTPSLPVSNWIHIESEANEMSVLIRANPNTMFALHHSQVSEKPFNFFVLDDNLLLGEIEALGSRFIINPRIISSLEGTEKSVDEGCVSFPYRKQKKVERAMVVVVEYDIPDPLSPNGLAHKQKQVERIIAQIFQHEADHAEGKNIYFRTPLAH